MMGRRNISAVLAAASAIALLAPGVMLAAVTVDNISLRKQGEFTEIAVYTSDHTTFKHEIVEPGKGRPFRIVLDINDALHKLPQYNFNELPGQTVSSIRTR
jgi:hypothetical protein